MSAGVAKPEGRTCKDCTSEGIRLTRPAPHPGPRCATHHRAIKAERKARAQQDRDARVYGLGAGGHQELMEIQGGTCAICQRATGATRRLSVDHDHATGEIRGLLCRPCNDMLGHARDDAAFFGRAVDYLSSPPAARLDPKFLTRRAVVDG